MRRITPPKRDLDLVFVNRTAKWLALWGVPELAREIRFEFSNRLSASLGISYPERGLIRLNISLLDQEQHLLEVALCHELAHVVIHRKHGKSVRPHGPEWQTLMRDVGFEPCVQLAGGRRASKKTAASYCHTCPICHMTRVARRPMRRWRCSRCVEHGLDGVLLIERVK
jgi:predicted SprT family Zn-dependent metalloprotease